MLPQFWPDNTTVAISSHTLPAADLYHNSMTLAVCVLHLPSSLA